MAYEVAIMDLNHKIQNNTYWKGNMGPNTSYHAVVGLCSCVQKITASDADDLLRGVELLRKMLQGIEYAV